VEVEPGSIWKLVAEEEISCLCLEIINMKNITLNGVSYEADTIDERTFITIPLLISNQEVKIINERLNIKLFRLHWFLR
jgi:hypothetical protein